MKNSGKFFAVVSALAIVVSALTLGLGMGVLANTGAETLTSGDMVQATIDSNFGKVTSPKNFDYELLMGNAEGTLVPFTHALSGEARVQDAASGSDPGRFISTWQIRGGKADSNVGFRITAKANMKFSVAFEATSDWAAGYFRTLLLQNGSSTQIDRTEVAAGTGAEPNCVKKTVDVQLQTGDVLLFYFGNEKVDWQTLAFQATFTADPSGYVPPVTETTTTASSSDAEALTSGDMVQATIDNNFGKVSSPKNFDYELLMSNAEGMLVPFTHALSGEARVQDAESGSDPGRFISTWQIRGGKADSNVGFRITAKANMKFSVAFEATSDWAAGYFRTLLLQNGSSTQIDRTEVAAGTGAEPNCVKKTVDVQLQTGDVLLFYFGNEKVDWQTLAFQATFTADPSGYVPPVTEATDSTTSSTESGTTTAPPAAAESLTNGDMVQATIDNNFGKVSTPENFDYELLMGSAEGTLVPFTHVLSGYPQIQDAASGSDPGRFISDWQIRGGKSSGSNNAVFQFTMKQNNKFSIQFEAKSDWASGYLCTALKAKDGTLAEIDRAEIAAGSESSPVVVNKTVEIQAQAGDVILFYFGSDTGDVQTVYFTATFKADPSAYVPNVTVPTQGKVERLNSGDMVLGVIENNLGKVTSKENFDYELLMGNAQGTLKPFSYSEAGDTPKVMDAANFNDQTRFISSFQLRGGKSDSDGNVAFRITAKKNIRFSISFEAKSDWASGYLRSVVVGANGARRQVDNAPIAAGTESSPVVVNKTVDVDLRAGDTLLFYFGSDNDVQTVYFNANFTADPNAFDAANSPLTGATPLYAGAAAILLALAGAALVFTQKKGEKAI